MTQPDLHVIEITVEYERAGRSRFPRTLALPAVALILAATVLFSLGGGTRSAPGVVAVSRCTVGTIPRVQAGYRPDAATAPKPPAGCR